MGYSYYTIHDGTVYENDSNASVTISRSGDTSYRERVYLYDDSDSARHGVDYNFSNGWVVFEPDQTIAQVPLILINDQDIDPDERFYIKGYTYQSERERDVYNNNHFSDSSYVKWSDSSASIYIIDDEKLPESVITVSDASATEGGFLSFKVSRSGDTSQSGRVYYYTSSGTGSERYDIHDVSSYVDFKEHEIEKTINVQTRDDSSVEEDETIYLNISTSTTGFKLSRTQATGTIIDNDIPPLETSTFGVDDISVKEGLTGEFIVRRYGETKSEGTVFYRLTQPGTGYSKSSSVRFEIGDETATIEVPTQDNQKYGSNSKYQLKLEKAVFDNKTSIADAYATMTVIDDDPKPNGGSAAFQITGGNRVGDRKSIQLKTADPDGNGKFTHTWQQQSAGTWSDIGTGGRFVLKDAQEGQELRVMTQYTDKEGFQETVLSNAGAVTTVPLKMAREGLFSGNSITLEFNRTLQSGNIGKSKFQVKDGKRLLRVKDALIDANEGTVTLNLDRDVTYYDDLLITYKDLVGNQTDGVVQDSMGNDLPSLSEFRVKNSFAGPIGGPTDRITAFAAEYDNGQILLELDDQANNHKLNRRRFKVWADNKRMKVTNATVEDDEFVILDVLSRNGRVINDDSIVKLSYKDLRGDQSKGVIEDMAGYDMLSINKMAVDVI